MFLSINLIVQCNGQYFKLGKINQNDDGSIYLFLISEKEKSRFKKTSIHTSGRINYDLDNKKVFFIEPISRITRINYICSLYVPSTTKLVSLSELKEKSNFIITLDKDTFFTIDFFICPDKKINSNFHNILSLKLLKNIFLNLSININKIDQRSNSNIVLYTPYRSTYSNQLIDRFEAEKEYRNILFQSDQGTIVGPNENGEFLLHFGNVMRVTPFVKIEFDNNNLFIDRLEGNRTKVKFVIKNKKYGNQLVKNSKWINIKNVILDAEIYENDFIPNSFKKVKESAFDV